MTEGAIPEHIQTKLRRLVDAKAAKTAADDAKKAADTHLETEQEACYDDLEELLGDVSSITIDIGPGYGRKTFTRQEQQYHTIYSKEMAFESLDAEALSDEATRPDFNGAFLNKMVQTRLRNNQPLPDGVGFRTKRWITVTSR